MKKLLLILISTLFFSSWMIVKPDQAEEFTARIKASYIYNFTKYIEWPSDSKQGSLVVGVLGTNPVFLTELNKTADKNNTKPENRKIEVISMASASDITKCHLIFILSDNSGDIADVANKVKNKNTLIVTEKPGMTKQGAGINFVIVDEKLKFELNKPSIESHNLKVAVALEALAVK